MAVNRDASISTIVGGIVGDVQDLVRKEIALARTEVVEELNTAKSGAIKLGISIGVLAIGGIMLLFALAGALADLLNQPTWVGQLIFGIVLAVVGYFLLSTGQKQIKQVKPVPEKTVETMKENVEWIKDRTTSDKT